MNVKNVCMSPVSNTCACDTEKILFSSHLYSLGMIEEHTHPTTPKTNSDLRSRLILDAALRCRKRSYCEHLARSCESETSIFTVLVSTYDRAYLTLRIPRGV